MKKILILFFIFYVGAIGATEITLICKGINNFYSGQAGAKKLNESIEVRFDDVAKKVTYVSPTKLWGCYDNEPDYTKSCNCSVTDTEIICKSRSRKNDGKFHSEQGLGVNRFSGILKFYEWTGGASSSGDGDYFMTQTGDLQCESFNKKKF
jgi:hypothetical protein